MTARKNILELSASQYQAIADIGLDAWYLKPMSRTETDVDKAHDALIDNLVDQLSDAPHPHPKASPSTEPVAPITRVLDESTTQSPAPRPVSQFLSDEKSTPSRQSRRVLDTPEPIKLVTSGVFSAPEENQLLFTAQVLPDTSWEKLQTASQALAEEAKQPCYTGQGNQNADDMFVFPPPERVRKNAERDDARKQLGLSDKEQQLLTEMLASIGLAWGETYRTRVIKHATDFGQDPNAHTLDAHLPLLASELALVQPKRIWLMGTLPSQVVLQTKAPLFTLAAHRYELFFNGVGGTQHAAQVICLPQPDYLLALPNEKGKVWQQIKRDHMPR